ncbi:unnamed protein product [Lactuca saligna]|uniref:Nuclease HARBI1 n=1 Tax=Lactuca saligna TaxID=75948 RepID=A0AA35UUH8_LACSI|nr:unnamed protein product [Lactuca saligna]
MDIDLPSPAHILKSRQMQVVHLICLLIAILVQHKLTIKNGPNLPTRETLLKRRRVREELLHNLSNGGQCRQLIRMSEQAFKKLCVILRRDGGLRPTQRMSVEEHVERFLHIVSNDLRNTFVSWMYRRSKSTTSRCFHRVLRSVIALESLYIQQPQGDVVPKEIQEKKRFFPYFKNCVGAIDGTHVRVKVPNRDAPRYRGRKVYPTINVLAACSFDLKFTYVLTGWEGTASDSRILKNALNRDDKLVIPNGRYYLVDAGLPHSTILMAPYRGVRYHLKEYSTRAPQNARELFNLRHASLRNAIERAFGVLKRRFPIIRIEDRDKDLEDENPIMNKQEPIVNTGKKSLLNWTEHMDAAFVDAMVQQQEKGNRPYGNFTSQAYANMVEEINTKLTMNLTKSHLKNRLKTLKSTFSQWYDMFNGISLSGFGWNADTQLIEVDEEVWDNLIKSKPDAIALKTKKVAHFEQMLVLFARDRASGENAETAKERNARFNNTTNIKIESISEVDSLLASNDVRLENQRVDDDEDDIQVVSPTPEQNSSAKKCKTKKRKLVDEVEQEVEPQPQPEPETFETKIMNAVSDVANAMREGNKIFERAYHHELTGDEIYQELQPMGLEAHEIPCALMYLARNQADARTLFTCPMNIRKDILKTMMRCSGRYHLRYYHPPHQRISVSFPLCLSLCINIIIEGSTICLHPPQPIRLPYTVRRGRYLYCWSSYLLSLESSG